MKSLENKLTAIQHKAGAKDLTPIVLDYLTITENYHNEPKIKELALLYLCDKYIHRQDRPFVLWYSAHSEPVRAAIDHVHRCFEKPIVSPFYEDRYEQ